MDVYLTINYQTQTLKQRKHGSIIIDPVVHIGKIGV